MDELCTALNAAGFHTYRISLTGHENERDDIFPAAQWTDDFAAGYRTARTLHPTLPIYIVAFSAGGLLATQFLDFSEHLDTKPRRMVLLAPALALRPLPRTAYFVRWFGPLKLRVRNLAPSSYRRFDTTPLFWYTNIIDLYDETRTLRRPQRLRTIPTLIFMSREDELISFSNLEAWIEENHLSASWKIEEVQPQPKDSDLYEHLIIDERSLGVEQWRRMVERITSFLIEAES
jgi:alpha-beta hydrolase superfamily lysophospholipase